MLMSSIAADVPLTPDRMPPDIAAKYGGRGWTPALKARFLDHLASRGNVRAACARVGLSAEAAYRLRRRDALFARAWAAALVLARESCVQVLAERAVDGVEENVWHRGEIVGTRRRYDARLLLAHIGRLDRLVEEEAAGADAGRFDELLARLAGEDIPDALTSEDGVLPLEREAAIDHAERHARYALRWQNEEETAADEDDGDPYGEDDDDYLDDDDDPYGEDEDYLDEHEREARRIEREARREAEERALLREERLMEAQQRARAEAAAAWDAWTGRACDVADKASGWNEAPPAPGLPGSGVPLAAVEAVKQAARDTAKLPEFSRPCTVSTVSTSTLAQSLAGTPRWHHPQSYAPPSRAALRRQTRRR